MDGDVSVEQFKRVRSMRKVMKSFVGGQSGATAVEYALIASLIAVFILAAFQTLGPRAAPAAGQIAGELAGSLKP